MPPFSPPPAPATDHKVSDLQALRGVSILLVLACHLSLGRTLVESFPRFVSMPFWIGVEVFFLISGYVIIHALRRDRYEPLSFLVKRVFRLTPAVLTFLALSAAVNLLFARSELPDYARQLFQVEWREFRKQALSVLGGFFTIRGGGSYSNGAMWSLSVEDQFYAALAVVCLVGAVVCGRRAPKLLPWAVCGSSAAIYLVLVAARVDGFYGGRLRFDLPAPLRYMYVWRFDFLALGIVTGYVDLRFGDRVRRALADRGPFLTPFLLGGPLALVALSEAELEGGGPVLHGFAMPVAGLCFAALVLAAGHGLAFPKARGWGFRALAAIGDRSYTIYLMHYPLMALTWWVFFSYCPWVFGNKLRYEAAQVVGLAIVLIPFVEAVYRGIELPLTAVGRRLSKRVRIIPADPAPDILSIARPEPLKIQRAA